MGVKHVKVISVADGGDTTVARPSDWNGDHHIDGDVNVAGYFLNNVADPVSPQDAATKAYVDAGSGGSGSLSVVANPDPGGTVNLSTGTIGWFYNGHGSVDGTINKPSASLPTAVFRWKQMDNGLASGFDWIAALNTAVVTSFGAYNQGTSFVTTATDDIWGAALASTSQGTLLANSSSGHGYGYRLHVPVDKTARTISIYALVHGGTATVTAHLEDGSAADATTTFSAVSGSDTFKRIDIDVTAGGPTFLDVSVILTAGTTGFSEVGFVAATMS